MGIIISQNNFIVDYLTVLRYSPRNGENDINKMSRAITNGIKNWTIKNFTNTLKSVIEPQEIMTFFEGNITLVPVPSSSLSKPDTLKVPFEICNSLAQLLDNVSINDCLYRHTSVPKSSSKFTKEDRPSFKTHYDSLRINSSIIYTDKVILVDDVLTTGTTSIACAKVIAEKFPNKNISIFALLRPCKEIPEEAINIRYTDLGKITLYPSNKTFIESKTNI